MPAERRIALDSAMPSRSTPVTLPQADHRHNPPTRADAIIVLGGGIRRDGSLTVVSRARVEHATALYRQGVAPRLILTGRCGVFMPKSVSEASAMHTHAHAAGVPVDALLLEEHARSTLGNARFTLARYLAPNRWRRVHIVTSDFHASRASSLFRYTLGDAFELSVSVVASGASMEERVLRWLEPFKRLSLGR